MAHLVLTVVGDDRPGLVSALADKVAESGGNWEQSELAELAGAFAGIVLISVPDERADELTAAVRSLEGLLSVTVHGGIEDERARRHSVSFTVLGNDRPGIVRDVTSAIAGRTLSIDAFRSRTFDAPMAGGTLFEATATVTLPDAGDTEEITRALERLAGEIQVDLTIG